LRGILTIKLGIIGGGVMGEALLSRLLSGGTYTSADILVSDPQAPRCEYLAHQYGVRAVDDNIAAITAVSAVLLAVKPQSLATVVEGVQEQSLQLTVPVISILAGMPLCQLETYFPKAPVIRVMPNTPAIVGAGMSAIALGKRVQSSHRDLALRLFQAVGEVVEVPETLMDAVTALSGSGPGYVAVFLEALTDGGVAVGLSRAISTQLALQTLQGTVQLLQDRQIHPAQLKDQVTSPGGTTITGIAHLEKAGFRSAVIEAVRAAYQRSQELGS
jgi:pyrroline-5-carboxylate reductase